MSTLVIVSGWQMEHTVGDIYIEIVLQILDWSHPERCKERLGRKIVGMNQLNHLDASQNPCLTRILMTAMISPQTVVLAERAGGRTVLCCKIGHGKVKVNAYLYRIKETTT